MDYKLAILVLAALFHPSLQHSQDPKEGNKINEFSETASSLFEEQNMNNVGDAISNLMQSEGVKYLLNAAMGPGKNGNQIIQVLGSLLNLVGGESSSNPALLLGILNSFSGSGDGTVSLDLMSLIGSLLGKDVSLDSLLGYVPAVMDSLNSFAEEAKSHAGDHSGHSWVLPPFLEKMHVTFDHFINSELGRMLIASLGTEKFVKALEDSEGKFSFQKFAELLENHSFRKYWIELVTRRIAAVVSYFADSETRESVFMTGQYLLNNFLTFQGFPKSTLFNPARPTETISALINHVFKKYLNYKVKSKPFVKRSVEQIQELARHWKKNGYLSGKGVDSKQLSQKMADTINLEIIEPIAKVYRAYRFIKKHPHCDKYVFCLVNQDQSNDSPAIPGVKTILSKSCSVAAGWFLGKYSGSELWSLSKIIFDADNCQKLHENSCNDYQIEETKVTTEYVHNEL